MTGIGAAVVLQFGHSPRRWSIRANQGRNDLSSLLPEVENNGFLSPDGSLSKRSQVSDWRTLENGSKSPLLVRPLNFPKPVNGSPVDGLSFFRKSPHARHLRGFSVCGHPPGGERRKGRFGGFSSCLSAVFLRLKRPPAFLLNRHFHPQNADILHFFLE